MALVCGTSYRLGDRTIRRMALIIAVCWVCSTLIQVTTGLLAEPAIAGDVICGLVALRLAWKEGRAWLWALVGVLSCLFVLHAVLYAAHQPPAPAEIVGNNLLATLALGVLLGAAIRNWRKGVRS